MKIWRIQSTAVNIFLVALALTVLSPVAWTVSRAFLPPTIAFQLPTHWVPIPTTLQNFPPVFTAMPFGTQLLNSLIIAVSTTLGVTITSTLAAYAFARVRFPGRDILFVVFLASLMLPRQVTVIPTFILMRTLGLVDSLEAIILPGLIDVLGIFLLRQYFVTIPRELEEAAMIDGASRFRILRSVVLPLSWPPIVGLGIYVFVYYWNEFFYANIFLTSPGNKTLPLGLVDLQGSYGQRPALVTFAAISLVLIPLLVLFFIAQRRITESVALTGING